MTKLVITIPDLNVAEQFCESMLGIKRMLPLDKFVINTISFVALVGIIIYKQFHILCQFLLN